MECKNIAEIYEIYNQHPVVTTDSRNCPAGSMFFALKGEKFNGNEYAAKAIETGCSYAVIDEPEFANGENFIVVDDVLSTLQQLASYHRSRLTIPVIGITGTNGKTTTKELTHAVLKEKFNTLATEGNLNNHIGVPLTILKIRPEHQIAIIEMGANHVGEIKFLCGIARPDYGLITNVGKAHLEGFGSFEGVIRTKTELYESIRHNGGKIFFHNENEFLKPYIDGIEAITYGESDNLFLSGEMTSCSPTLSFRFSNAAGSEEADTQLIGSYNLPNALAAAAIGTWFGVENSLIRDALQNYAPANKRSQLIKTEKNTIILDAYNANPTSMMAALTNFEQMQARRKMVILGDMRELGLDSLPEHQKIIDFLNSCHFNNVILVGPEFGKLDSDFISLDNSTELDEWMNEHPVQGYHILVKGSRGIALEKGIGHL